MEEEQYIMIGNNFRYFREKNKLSQEKMAEALDISTNHLYKIENGKVHMSLSVLLNAKNIFKVTANDLLENPNEIQFPDFFAREISDILKQCNIIERNIIIQSIKDLYQTLRTYKV